MKRVQALFVSLFALFFVVPGPALSTDLTVDIENVKNHQGSLIVSLFCSSNAAFPVETDMALRKAVVPAQQGKQTVTFENISYGRYAISVIHDENNNGKMDRNSLGMPQEGFGYSNHPAIFFGTPKFEYCTFDVSTEEHKITITLSY